MLQKIPAVTTEQPVAALTTTPPIRFPLPG
jgi:hypothetical protein